MWLILRRGFKSHWSCPAWSPLLVPKKQRSEEEKEKKNAAFFQRTGHGTISTVKELVIRRKGELEPIWALNPP